MNLEDLITCPVCEEEMQGECGVCEGLYCSRCGGPCCPPETDLIGTADLIKTDLVTLLAFSSVPKRGK